MQYGERETQDVLNLLRVYSALIFGMRAATGDVMRTMKQEQFKRTG